MKIFAKFTGSTMAPAFDAPNIINGKRTVSSADTISSILRQKLSNH